MLGCSWSRWFCSIPFPLSLGVHGQALTTSDRIVLHNRAIFEKCLKLFCWAGDPHMRQIVEPYQGSKWEEHGAPYRQREQIVWLHTTQGAESKTEYLSGKDAALATGLGVWASGTELRPSSKPSWEDWGGNKEGKGKLRSPKTKHTRC